MDSEEIKNWPGQTINFFLIVWPIYPCLRHGLALNSSDSFFFLGSNSSDSLAVEAAPKAKKEDP